ncbi:MAG: hypothetical protein JXM70_23985 [Pirellulales bacterium]|nr:hypothetical protein [Pirellulales bacterium]
MIAPLRPPQTKRQRVGRQIYEARDFVAATLLGKPRSRGDNGPPIAPVKAWTFALWAVAITAAYGTAMLGWW